MFGLIRYKSDDFSENSNSNSEICVVVMLSFLMSLILDSREYILYNLHELSELVNLDQSRNLWANVGTR